jgi:DNA-directed RNA polymerase beta subunit
MDMEMQGTKVFLNGRWIGVNRNPDGLKKALLKLRRADSISNDVSIVYDHALNEIRVNNDWGRVCRPLFVVEDGKIKLTKHEVKQIKVRFLSPVLCVHEITFRSFQWTLCPSNKQCSWRS